MEQDDIPFLELLLEECERFMPFCNEKNHYKNEMRVKYICLAYDKDCINLNHAICQECLKDRWICGGHNFMHVRDFMKTYIENIDQLKKELLIEDDYDEEQVEYLARCPEVFRDLVQLKKQILAQKKAVLEMEENLNQIIGNYILTRDLMLPKEIDLAKIFYSLKLFHSQMKDEQRHSANYLETMQKHSIQVLQNLNRGIEYILSKLPVNENYVVHKARRRFDNQDSYKKNQLFDIEFDTNKAIAIYKQSDDKARKIYVNHKKNVEESVQFLQIYSEHVQIACQDHIINLDRVQQEHNDLNPAILKESWAKKQGQKLMEQTKKGEDAAELDNQEDDLQEEMYYEKEIIIVLNDQQSFMNNLATGYIEDISWIPSEAFKYKELIDQFGIITCKTIEDIKNLTNFGTVERKTGRSKVIIFIEREHQFVTFHDVTEALQQFIKTLRLQYFNLSVVVNVADYLSKPQDFSTLYESLLVLSQFEIIHLDLNTMKFEAVNQMLEEFLRMKIRVKKFELVLNEQAFYTRVADTLFELAKKVHFQSIFLVMKFRLDKASKLNSDQEYIQKQLFALKKVLERSLPGVKGLALIFQFSINKNYFKEIVNSILIFNSRNILKHLTLYLPNSSLDQLAVTIIHHYPQIQDFSFQISAFNNLRTLNLNLGQSIIGYGVYLQTFFFSLSKLWFQLQILHINLPSIKLGDVGVSQVIQGLQKLYQGTLQQLHLNFQQNGCTSDSAEAIASFMDNKCLSTLRKLSLNLANNNLGAKGADKICDGIELLSHSLTDLSLNLSDNFLENEGGLRVCKLVDDLGAAVKFLQLKLSRNQFHDIVAQQLGLSLKRIGISDNVTILDPSKLGVSDLEALNLNVSHNYFGAEASIFLIDAVERAPLKINCLVLFLEGCPISEIAMVRLYNHFKKSVYYWKKLRIFMDKAYQSLEIVQKLKEVDRIEII